MKSTDYLWLTPFLLFFGSYIGMHLLFYTPSVEMPHIIGMNLIQATKLLSQQQLHLEIISIKQIDNLPDGTIVHQKPQPGRLIKQQQTIYVVVSEPTQATIPNCIGLSTQEIAQLTDTVELHHIPYSYPVDHCFAQWPSPGHPATEKLICYIAQKKDDPVLCPNFKSMPFDQVSTFLTTYGIHYQTNIAPKEGKLYYVLKQIPKPGAVIHLGDAPEKITFYFEISTNRP